MSRPPSLPWLVAALLLLVCPAWAATPEQVKQGEYMMRAADCMACHTQPGGTPFAGGRAIGTPFGQLYSPNITPDIDTGIGKWSDDQFYAALHDGVGHGVGYLYPVMPYTSYTRMTREDVLAIKAYLFSLKPVFSPMKPNGLNFPFDIRATLFVWRELFFRPGTYVADPAHDAQWNRGAYLVLGAGHCGECHSPRNLMGAVISKDSLAGGQVQQWTAPNISASPLQGIGDRSVADLAAFLRTGSSASMGTAFGPMAEVVHDSLSFLTEADVTAMAVYLKDTAPRASVAPPSNATTAGLLRGRTLYLQNCGQCHQDNGRGIPGVIPNLAGNAVITSPKPNDIAAAILNGLKSASGLQMPGFAGALSNQDVADISNYIRVSWNNLANPDSSAALVANVRQLSDLGVAGSEAARAFDCPKVGGAAVPGALTTASDVALLAGAADPTARIAELLTALRQQQPGISNAALTNGAVAAFCPIIANSGLSLTEKRARMLQVSGIITEEVTAIRP